MTAKRSSDITDRSQQRVRELVDELGTAGAATVLGVRQRQVERWEVGTGKVNPADTQRIGAAHRRIDILGDISAHSQSTDEKTNRALRAVATSGASATRAQKAQVMRWVWEVAPDDAPDLYETLFG